MQLVLEQLPPQMLIGLVATVVWGIVAIVLGLPLVRAWTRRMERRSSSALPPSVDDRLARIEAAVDSIAIEVERISEGQRFLTRIQTEKPLPPRNSTPERPG